MTIGALLELPPTVGVAKAAEALGMSPNHAYKLLRGAVPGEAFPCAFMRHGNRYRIITADLHRVLRLTQATSAA